MNKTKVRKLFEEWVKKEDSGLLSLSKSNAIGQSYQSTYTSFATDRAFAAFCAAIEYMEDYINASNL